MDYPWYLDLEWTHPYLVLGNSFRKELYVARLSKDQIEVAIADDYTDRDLDAELAAYFAYGAEEDDRESEDVMDVGQNPVWCPYCVSRHVPGGRCMILEDDSEEESDFYGDVRDSGYYPRMLGI
jgi:hypothetical protein